MLDALIRSFWFEKVNNLGEQYLQKQNEENKIFEFIQQFQNGNFEQKKDFCNYFLSSPDRRVFTVGMRLFMAIAGHEDFRLLENFLNNCDEEQLRTFLAFVQESLSLHAIPYLLALFEDWEETYVGNDIARCICAMLGQRYYEDEEYNLNQLGDMFTSFSTKNSLELFYYKGEKYYPGNLTKTIIEIAINCYKSGTEFYTDQMPSILSNSSGIKCPVSYGKKIDGEIIKELYEYVATISNMEWEIGGKSFYKHKIRQY